MKMIISKEIKKILPNEEVRLRYLEKLNEAISINEDHYREIKRGKNKGKKVLKDQVKTIQETWDDDISTKIIREIFEESKKYKAGGNAYAEYKKLTELWEEKGFGELKWPCSQGELEPEIQKINSENISEEKKEGKVIELVKRFRLMKDINTKRHDYIEFLIFENNKQILPTLNHRRYTDYFINGKPYDQKVAKSPTKQFINKYKDNWKEEAKNRPEEVAKFLYSEQDEGRFGSEPRLFVVYLDEDISRDDVKQRIKYTNLEKPLEINFTYKHKHKGEQEYVTSCFVILLYKNQ